MIITLGYDWYAANCYVIRGCTRLPFVWPYHLTSVHSCSKVSYICTAPVWMFHVTVYHVQGYGLMVLPRIMWYGVVLGHICETKSHHQCACILVGVIHMHGTRMDIPRDRLPCTMLGYDWDAANYVIRGCTRFKTPHQYWHPHFDIY
jgi:hypothetical protein